jgi:hypothetical protein
MLALLQPEKTCTLTGFTFGTIAPYNVQDLSVVILIYSVEGCGGGNNWHSAIAAFDIKQSGKSISDIRLHKFSPDLERAMTFAGINTINSSRPTSARNPSPSIPSIGATMMRIAVRATAASSGSGWTRECSRRP